MVNPCESCTKAPGVVEATGLLKGILAMLEVHGDIVGESYLKLRPMLPASDEVSPAEMADIEQKQALADDVAPRKLSALQTIGTNIEEGMVSVEGQECADPSVTCPKLTGLLALMNEAVVQMREVSENNPLA